MNALPPRGAKGGQLALPFVHVPHLTAAEFLRAPSNDEAVAWLGRDVAWPAGRLALFGERSVGKTHLLHIWADARSARLVHGEALTFEPPASPLAIDDADRAPPLALLHVLNAAAEAGQTVLLAARLPPAQWPVGLADLSSRLKAMPAVGIAPPEETLLRALLARLLAERQLAVPEPVQAWMLMRLPRSPAAVREAAARFDRASLVAETRNQRLIAAHVIGAMDGAAEHHGTALRDNEDFAPSQDAASPEAPGLL